MKRLYKVTPTRISGSVDIPADDTRIEIDKKTKDAVRDPETQQPIVEELGTVTIQRGPSERLEYPHFSGSTHTALLAPHLEGAGAEVWLVEAHEVIHELMVADQRCAALTWKEANGLVGNLIEFVLPSDLVS